MVYKITLLIPLNKIFPQKENAQKKKKCESQKKGGRQKPRCLSQKKTPPFLMGVEGLLMGVLI